MSDTYDWDTLASKFDDGTPTSPSSAPAPAGDAVGPSPASTGDLFPYPNLQRTSPTPESPQGYPFFGPGGATSPEGGTAEQPLTWRQKYKETLSDQTRRELLKAYTDAEVGGQGSEAQQAFIESVVNRAEADGKTIEQVLNSNYFPAITHQRAAAGIGKDRSAQYDPLIDDVIAGSNKCNYCTGNASGGVGFNKGPKTASYEGEDYGIEGQHSAWAQAQGYKGPLPNVAEMATKRNQEWDKLEGKFTEPKEHAKWHDYFAAANATLGETIGLLADAMGYPADLANSVYNHVTQGTDIEWSSPRTSAKQIAALFDKVGINYKPDNSESFGWQSGQATANGLLSLAVTSAALPKIAEEIGARVAKRLMTTEQATSFMTRVGQASESAVKNLSEALSKHPYTAILTELGAAPGYIAGEEKGGPLGGFAGALAGGGIVQGLNYISRKAAALAARPVQPLYRMVRDLLTRKPPGMRNIDDVIDQYHANTAKLDNLDEQITEQAKAYRALPKDADPNERLAAATSIRASQVERDRLTDENRALEPMLPKVARDRNAIRPAWVDPAHARTYGEDQVKGMYADIEGRVMEAINNLPRPAQSSRELQIQVRKGLEEVRLYAQNIVKAMWERTPMRAPVPMRGIKEDAIRLFQDLETSFHESYIPRSKMNELLQMNDEESIAKLRSFVGTINDEITAEKGAVQIGKASRRDLIANLTKLEQIINKGIADAVPGDATIDQARAISTKYHDLFTRSDLYDLLERNRVGKDKVPVARTVTEMLDSEEGLENLLTMTRDEMMWRTIPGEATMFDYVDKTTLGPQAKAKFAQLVDDTKNTVRALVRENIDDIPSVKNNPIAAARIAEKAETLVKPLADLHIELDNMGKALRAADAERQGVEKSALARYIKQDVASAMKRIWSDPDPAAQARTLIKAFRGDPDALSGFRASFIDELANRAGAKRGSIDPATLKGYLDDPKWNKLARTLLSEDQFKRLSRVTDIALRIEKGEYQTLMQKHGQGLLMMGRIFGVQMIGHPLAIVTGRGGGSLQMASIGGKMGTRMIQKMLGQANPSQDLLKAIYFPEWEKFMYRQTPQTLDEAQQSAKMLRRALAAMETFRQQTHDYWAGTPNRDPVPPSERQFTSNERAGVDIAEKIGKSYKINPESFDAAMNRNPSTNVEDRRYMTSPNNPFTNKADYLIPGKGFGTSNAFANIERQKGRLSALTILMHSAPLGPEFTSKSPQQFMNKRSPFEDLMPRGESGGGSLRPQLSTPTADAAPRVTPLEKDRKREQK